MDIPLVIVANHPDPKFKQRRKLVLIIILLVVVILLPVVVFVVKNNSFQFSKPALPAAVKPTLIRQATLAETNTEGHPELFYAKLEYNPKTSLVTQLAISQTTGDLRPLRPTQPLGLPEEFVYRIEVISDQNEILQNGWGRAYKELIVTPANTYGLQIYAPYTPNAIIRMYLPDGKLVWTGRMK